MITAAQLAAVQDGDVVELHEHHWADGVVLVGSVASPEPGVLAIGAVKLQDPGWTVAFGPTATLTVISRKPGPVYVNHSRAEPAAGDFACDADSDEPGWWFHDDDGDWLTRATAVYDRDELPNRLRLLVDGNTGQVVP